MNTELSRFIVQFLEKEADIIIEPEFDENKSLDSCNIVVDDINLEERESKFDKTESLMRNSKL